MKALVILSIVFMSFSSFAADSVAVSNFKAALELRVGILTDSQELKIEVVQTDDVVCGSSEPMLVATLFVARSERTDNGGEGGPTFKRVWEEVKSYAVSVEEAASLAPHNLLFMTSDTCAE